jgi:hypothetical protein
MKKSRRQSRQRQQKRRRRQSRKPRISRGGTLWNHAMNAANRAMNAASICANTIRLVKNVNNSIETFTFCQRIDTSSMNQDLVRKFDERLSKLKEKLEFIAHNNVVSTIVSFTVRFFDGNSSSELQKLTVSIPNEVVVIAKRTTWDRNTLFDVVNAANIIMWGEGYNTELTEATSNLIAVVTEMIALQIGLPMKSMPEATGVITAPLGSTTPSPLLNTELLLSNVKPYDIRAPLTRPRPAVLDQTDQTP